MMLHIPNILSKCEVLELRAQLSAADWVDGKQTVGAQGARVKQNRQLPEHSTVSQALSLIVLSALKKNAVFFSAALPHKIVPPLFNSYEGSEHYGLHVDGAIRQLPFSEGHIRTDLSATLFLSEPEDYDGGELEVLDTYGTHEVKLPAGDLILYPSTSLHQVKPIIRGERVCSFLWIQSMIKDDQQRTMLFTMDQHIQSLRSQLGDNAEILGLTAQYHNLLRMWSEV
jgi:PKHD-type hydroxylase